MRKVLLLSLLAVLGLVAKAQNDPVITLTAEVDGAERTFGIGSAADGNNVITIDWGDGKIVDGTTITTAYDGYTPTNIVGTPLGEGKIKIYATAAIRYFDCVSKITGPGLTELDITKATDLTELSANGNKLTTIDLSKNTKLTNAQLSNNSLNSIVLTPSLTKLDLQKNKLTAFDGSVVPNLTVLYLSNNTITSLDLSKNTSLTSAYLLSMGLESLNIGANATSKLIVSANNNKLTTLDVTAATGLANGRLFLLNNNLTELKYTKIGTANLAGNKFTMATLPIANITTLTYAPQQPMEIGGIDKTIDLSSQNNLTGYATAAQTTTYTWYTKDGTALVANTDYTESNGKFSFIKQPSDSVYCVMATTAFPKFTGTSAFKTANAKVNSVITTAISSANVATSDQADVYSVDGKLIGRNANVKNLQKGLYIIRKADNTSKLMIE